MNCSILRWELKCAWMISRNSKVLGSTRRLKKSSRFRSRIGCQDIKLMFLLSNYLTMPTMKKLVLKIKRKYTRRYTNIFRRNWRLSCKRWATSRNLSLHCQIKTCKIIFAIWEKEHFLIRLDMTSHILSLS